MNTVNQAIAELVDVVAMLIDNEGWGGHGIRSVEHWVAWKAGVSPKRAARLCTIARRKHDLPLLWEAFRAGRLTEDVMSRLAARLPAARDAEMARLAPSLMVGQLTRILASCPELVDGRCKERTQERRRSMGTIHHGDGWLTGSFSLPPEEAPGVLAAFKAGRDAEFRDRRGCTDPDVEAPTGGDVTWADGLVRVCSEGLDALDGDLQRTGVAGDRHHLVLHRDVTPTGLDAAQVHLGPVVRDSTARFFGRDTGSPP